MTGAGTIAWDGGTFTLNGTMTTANSVLAGGELLGNSVINSSCIWTGGYIGGSAALTLGSNATLAVDGGK